MRLWLLVLMVVTAAPLRAQEAPRLGLFGTVTALAPLTVAGRAVEVPEGVPLLSVLGTGGTVAEGDTLALVVRAREGRLVAERMLQVFAVIGPVGAVAQDAITVMGTHVHLPPAAAVAPDGWIAVSGLWSGGRVITTGLKAVEGSGFGQLTGVVEDGLLGESRLTGAQPAQEGFGNGVWILGGVPQAAGLRVTLMSRGVFGGPVDLVRWQGYASAPIASQTYEIYGSGITGTARDAQMPEPGTLISRCAREGRVIAAPPDGLEAAFGALGCTAAVRDPPGAVLP